MANTFFAGDSITMRATFRNAQNVLVDPDVVNLTVKCPDGSAVSLPATKESTGVYFSQYVVQESGVFYYRFFGTDPPGKSGEGWFTVERSRVGTFVIDATGTAAASGLGASGTGAA